MKQKLLFLLVLLLTATTGAWATTPNSIVINGTPQVGDKSISLTYHFDPNNVTGLDDGYAPTLKVKCAADNKWDETSLSSTEVSSGTTTISLKNLGEFEAGKTYEVCFAYNNGNWVDEVFQSFVPAAPTYSITLAEGTEDAGKWTIDPTEAAEGSPVTATYSGERKVKSVKAVKVAKGKVVDLSTYSGDSYEVTEDVTFTGTTNNEINILYKGEGYEVTLDNVNAPKCYIVAGDDIYTVNVKLKGTSRLAGIYDQNAYIIIGEAAAGGTVILVDESSPLGGNGTTITINGGTVKAKTSAFYTVYNTLVVNGGAVYLEAADDYPAVAGGEASGSVNLYGWNGSAWETYSKHRYLSTDNSKAPSEWTW